MDLILWRHAEAVPHGDPSRDLERELTAKGARQAERIGEWLAARLPESTRILVSPAVRCQQTAQALGREFKTVDAIAPDVPGSAVLESARWPSRPHPVLVVGHQPTLGLAAALALTETERPWALKKGAVWWLRRRDQDEQGQVIVVAVQSPDCV